MKMPQKLDTRFLPFLLFLHWEAPLWEGLAPSHKECWATASLPSPPSPCHGHRGWCGATLIHPTSIEKRPLTEKWKLTVSGTPPPLLCTKLSHPILLQRQEFHYRALHSHWENKAAALYPCSVFWQRGFCCCSALLRALAVLSWLTAPDPAAQPKQVISLLQDMLQWWRAAIPSSEFMAGAFWRWFLMSLRADENHSLCGSAVIPLLIDAWSGDNELWNELVHLSLGQDRLEKGKVTKWEDAWGAQELRNRAMNPSKNHLCSLLLQFLSGNTQTLRGGLTPKQTAQSSQVPIEWSPDPWAGCPAGIPGIETQLLGNQLDLLHTPTKGDRKQEHMLHQNQSHSRTPK